MFEGRNRINKLKRIKYEFEQDIQKYGFDGFIHELDDGITVTLFHKTTMFDSKSHFFQVTLPLLESQEIIENIKQTNPEIFL